MSESPGRGIHRQGVESPLPRKQQDTTEDQVRTPKYIDRAAVQRFEVMSDRWPTQDEIDDAGGFNEWLQEPNVKFRGTIAVDACVYMRDSAVGPTFRHTADLEYEDE